MTASMIRQRAETAHQATVKVFAWLTRWDLPVPDDTPEFVEELLTSAFAQYQAIGVKDEEVE